jgi:Xaa-Pro aminopeptidase
MRQQLTALREIMKEKSVTAWLSPCSDEHGSEYIGAHDECTKFLSGFTGDSCTVLVMPENAYLWTDGRYFVQASAELQGSGVDLMKIGEPGVPALADFLAEHLKKGDTLAFSARLFGASFGQSLIARMEKNGVSVRTDEDLIAPVWKDRPARSMSRVWIHEQAFAGASVQDKLAAVRAKMKEEDCGIYLTSALDETAWLTNLRASDIECNPVFLSYLMISEKDCRLFVQDGALDDSVRKYCAENGLTLCAYDSWMEEVRKLKDCRILMDLTASDYETWQNAKNENQIVDVLSPISYLKCIKNPTEIGHMKKSHLRDGAYVTKFMYWLKKEIAAAEKEGRTLTEVDASDHLDALRAADKNYVSLSFPTISAYESNAAMCHYMAQKETAAQMHAKGLYLVDSGAQYLDGTTDITRTFALGGTTAAEKRDFTLTVIGMLRLLHAVFPKGIRGINLDTFAREAMWQYGVDFNHGTGHGVGFLNNVHEMPVSVRVRPSADTKRDIPFEPGMVTSDEPGVYIDGEYGIRTENMILCREDPDHTGFLGFETLTFAPIDPEVLDVSLMNAKDIEWLNEYQKDVREKISPYLDEDEKMWLAKITETL